MEFRFRLMLISLVGLVALAVWTFPAWRGYLRDQLLVEAFPGLEMDLQDDFLALPADQRQALLEMRLTSPQSALGMVLVADWRTRPGAESEQDFGEAAAARVLASGEFTRIDALHWGAGTATIYELSNQRILRFQDFASARGGDVRVYLSRDPQPRNALELGQ